MARDLQFVDINGHLLPDGPYYRYWDVSVNETNEVLPSCAQCLLEQRDKEQIR